LTGEGASSRKALATKKPPLPSNLVDILAMPSPPRGEGTNSGTAPFMTQ
jgi:hypothetical protein